MKKILWIFLSFVVIILLMAGLVYFLAGTPQGLMFISKNVLRDVVPAEDIEIGKVSGKVTEGLTISQVELRHLKGFPAGSSIRIQRLTVLLKSLDLNALDAEFENIRVFLPNSEPIVLSGRFSNGQLFCNVYSNSVSIKEILSFLPKKLASDPRGTITGIDLYVTGPPAATRVKGKFIIGELVMPRFKLTEAPGELVLLMKRVDSGFSPSGELSVTHGKVKTKFAMMQLLPSRLYFTKTFASPGFDIKGQASVGKVTMDIALRGSPQAPVWKFSSNPPLPEEILMLMFVTGKSFEIAQASLEQQKLTPDVAKDLIDYLILGGEGGRFAEKFGIKDLSLIYEKDSTGIGVTKEVTRYLDVGYQIEQETQSNSERDIKHTLGAEFKLSPKLSVEVDKEIYQYRNQEQLDTPLKTDDKILLKYRTQF